MNDEEFFEQLEELQAQSVEKLVAILQKREAPPAFQFPYHVNHEGNENLHSALQRAQEGLEKPAYFLAAGMGDGFPLVLANRLGYESYGIELIFPFFKLAEDNIWEARDLLDDSKLIVPKLGNMFGSDTYAAMGMPFEEFDVMYTWQAPSLRDAFIKKFSEEAKRDARLVIPRIKERQRGTLLERLEGRVELLYDGPVQVYHRK